MSIFLNNEFVIGVLAGIASSILLWIIQYIIKSLIENNKPFSGIWENHIYDDSGNVIKRDELIVKQNDETLSGDIKRLEPQDQAHRKWKMFGKVRGANLFAIFWSTNTSITSYGCWFVHQKSDFLYEGYYLKLDEATRLKVKPIRLDFVRSSKGLQNKKGVNNQ